MAEQVLIRGVVMGKNAAGQKLVQPLMNNADGLRIWTDDKNLIPVSDVVKPVRCNDCINHTHCVVEDILYKARKVDRFCSMGRRKDNATD